MIAEKSHVRAHEDGIFHKFLYVVYQVVAVPSSN
jgi:hypothetical protein